MARKILRRLIPLVGVAFFSPCHASMIYGETCIEMQSGFEKLSPKVKPDNIVLAESCDSAGWVSNIYYLLPELNGKVCVQRVEGHSFDNTGRHLGRLGGDRRIRWALPEPGGVCSNYKNLDLIYVERVSVEEFLLTLSKAKEIFLQNREKFKVRKCSSGEMERLSISEIRRANRSQGYPNIYVTFASTCPELGGRSLALSSPAAEIWQVTEIVR